MRKYLVVKVLRQMSHRHCFCVDDDDVKFGGAAGEGDVFGEGGGGGEVTEGGEDGAVSA